eukprot:1159965-Pelagomonas_calceolata.AAC.21
MSDSFCLEDLMQDQMHLQWKLSTPASTQWMPLFTWSISQELVGRCIIMLVIPSKTTPPADLCFMALLVRLEVAHDEDGVAV